MRVFNPRGSWFLPVILLVVAPALAQMEGDLDPSFGDPLAPGRQIAYFDLGGSFSDIAVGAAVDSTGRSVLVGSTVTADATNPYAIAVARFTNDGQPDTSFGGTLGGRYVLDLTGSQELPARTVVVEPSGSIVVAGTRFFGSTSTAVGLFARILPDGSALSGSPVYFNLPSTPLALPPNVRGFVRDGSGGFYAYGNEYVSNQAFVARLTGSFVLDTSFSGDGWTLVDPFAGGATGTSAVRAMTVDRQGRLLAAVDAQSTTGDTVTAIVRLLPSGTVDSSFGSGGVTRLEGDFLCGTPGICDEIIRDLVVAPNGEIFAVGSVTVDSLPPAPLGWVVRLSSAGAITGEAADLPLAGLELELFGVVLDPRGGLLVAGSASDASQGAMHVARYDASTLSVDPNFGLGGRQEFNFIGISGFTLPAAAALALVADGGRAMAVGGAVFGLTGSNSDFAVARLYSEFLLHDGFELGSTVRWSSSVGAP